MSQSLTYLHGTHPRENLTDLQAQKLFLSFSQLTAHSHNIHQMSCYISEGSCVLVSRYQLQSFPYLVVRHSLVFVILVSNSGTQICLPRATCHTQRVTLNMYDFREQKTCPNLLVELGLH